MLKIPQMCGSSQTLQAFHSCDAVIVSVGMSRMGTIVLSSSSHVEQCILLSARAQWRSAQGRIYSKPGPVQKKCGGPSTIIGLLVLPPTVPSITSLPDCLHTYTKSYHFIDNFIYLIYYFNDFRAISVCWHVAEIFFGPQVGAPFLWGPLFGRTCWTCLNLPLGLLPDIHRRCQRYAWTPQQESAGRDILHANNAKNILTYLRRKYVTFIESPNSPDLIPVDYAVWNVFQRMECRRWRLTSVEQLQHVIITKWAGELSQRFIDGAIN